MERIGYAARSLPSEDHPSWNEDAFRIDEEHDLMVLCDGIGGHHGGREAANAAADAVVQTVMAWEDIDEDDPDVDLVISTGLANALNVANRRVTAVGKELFSKASKEERAVWRSPGTTVVLVKLHRFKDGRLMAYVANAGDCRAYVLHGGTGELEQVTNDHDMLEDMDYIERNYHVRLSPAEVSRLRAKMDTVQNEGELPDGLERDMFKMRNVITSSVSSSSGKMKIDSYRRELKMGDRIILTSDGVHDNLSSQKTDKDGLPSIADISARSASPEECAAELTAQAHDYADKNSYKGPRKKGLPQLRAKRDDMTALVADLK